MKTTTNPGRNAHKIRTSNLVKGAIFALSALIAIGSASLDVAQASASYSGHGYTAVQVNKKGRPTIRVVDASGARALAAKGYTVTKTATFSVVQDSSASSNWTPPAINDVAADGILVAVIDTGVDDTHEWMAGRVVKARSFVDHTDPETEWRDGHGHGTHVAGIIRQAYPAAQIMAVRVLDADGSGTDYGVAQGILWAVDNGAQVLNVSLGGSEDAPAIEAAILYAKDRNVVTVVAAGNEAEYGSPTMYPAAYPTVLAVAAVDNSHEVAWFSNRGTYVDIAAQGVSVMSSFPGNNYVAMSGTSMATPNAAGIVARVKALHPDWSESVIRQHVEATSTDLGTPGPDSTYGWGEINAEAAIAATSPVATVGEVPSAGDLVLNVVPFVWGVNLIPADNILDFQVVDIDRSILLYTDNRYWGLDQDRRLSLDAPVNVMVLGTDRNGTPFTPIYMQLAPLPVRLPKITVTGTGATISISVTAIAPEGILRVAVYEILASGQSVTLINRKLRATGKTMFTTKTQRSEYRSTRYQACFLDFSEMPFGCTALLAAK